jgi:threonine synthase
MGPLVQKTGGEIFQIREESAVDIARLVAYERVIKIGPASAAGIAGLFESLKRGYFKDGESVLINMGEGAGRALSFMQETAYTVQDIHSVDDCLRFDRDALKAKVWEPFE